jgi:hypothetical protein
LEDIKIRKSIFITILLGGIVLFAGMAAAGVRYVPADYTTIQAAIDAADEGDTIIVAAGRYVENINFCGKSITLTSTNPTNKDIINSTIIDGNDANSVVTFSGTESSNCVLTGFTITHGRAAYGGGVYGNGTMATIKNNTICGNKAIGGGKLGDYGAGGGLLDCNGLIQNNIITSNSAGFGGGLDYCNGVIRNNIISDNGWYAGGGMFGCHGTVSNNLVVRNYAVQDGGGLALCNGTITNCIIWGNSPDQIQYTSVVRYSDIQGGWPGEGNIDADPCFADPDANDFHLQSAAGRWDPNTQSWVTDAVTSPCIDAGNPGCPLGDEPNDANNIRINMGAYGGTAEASKTPADWRSIADLTNDWAVDFNDLGVFVSYWLDSGECIPSDLNRNESIDFDDYAIFAQQWLGTTAAEPGIEYQISPCQMGLSTTEQMDQTRFTVTVEGRYIHFEDMMVANCCPKELWLEMTVENNLITVYENEWGGVCLCICDYPVTATLGPFKPGTYTFEVYNGGFVGSTTVTIE